MEYRARRGIAAPPERVWAALIDVDGWPAWDPGIIRVEGRAVDGGRLKVYSKLSPKRAFPVRVALEPVERLMTWTGGMPLGLFTGVRNFKVTPSGAGAELDMHEVYTGPLVGLMAKKMPDLQPSFDDFADGLKSHCEQGPA